ncbi:MAG: MFS transporter [Firmicutes bacterium]|nr:MFS transporter [Bacillota bacterium]MBR0518068.1 MFS transporter [Bacillota bacterium]MBR4142122.1 MFS transporter [Bacillota bacterium]MBR6970596.1 MFS transporter [Bacillota bacterium]
MKSVPAKTKWIFAIGQLGWSILSGIIANLLVNFYLPDSTGDGVITFVTSSTFIGLTVIGIITACGRLVDAVTDPWIANMSDNCGSKLGKRIPFLRYAALPFALVTVLIFCCPVRGESPVNIVWLAVTLILFYIFMTAYCTPYNALIPVLGRSQKDRMDISTYISLTYIVGTGIAFGGKMIWEAVYAATGWDYYVCARLTLGVLALIALICMLLPAFLINEKEYDDTPPVKENAFKSLAKTFRNHHFRVFVLSDVIYWIGITIFNTGFIYYVEVLLELNNYMILFIFMTFVTFVCYPIVNVLSRRFGKKKLLVWGFALFGLAFLVSSFAGKVSFIPNQIYGFIICVLVGVPLSILGVIPQAIVADIAESDNIETGENHDAMFYAARTFAFKLGQSIAMIIFTSLAVIGQYTDVNAAGEQIIRNTGTGYRISLVIALILCIAAMGIILLYDEKKVMSIIESDHE